MSMHIVKKVFWFWSERSTLKPVWLRDRGCVSYKTHCLSVWLKKKSCSLYMDPLIYCVSASGKWKAAICCFLRGMNCSVNTGACLHCSPNSFFFLKQWRHASTVQWTCLFFFFLTSVVNWFYSHCSSERKQQFFLKLV